MDRLTLDLAHAALAAAIACECGRKAHIPGDATEDHEDNTFGLPDGAPIRKKMRAFYREQLKHVVGFVEKIGAEIPAVFPKMSDYDDPMASAMTPILGVYWSRAGKGLRGRLGLDPDEWRVTDPNIHKAIAKQALTFCRATNATTDRQIGAAAEAIREKLRQGLIGTGQSIPELTAAVRECFTRASKSKAETIARTESSRAIHAATEMSAEASGVVSGKRWLLSANSCPICVSLAEKANSVPLGASFGTVGRSATYSEVKNPPAHPNCCLPETPIVAPLGVAGMIAQYDGPVVRIRFSEGSEVAVTPNHMLLTLTGFARAADLVEGDDVIRCLDREVPAGRHPDNNRKPTTIQEIVHSWAKAGGGPAARVPVSTEYLHGDAAFCHGDIDVVTADGLLGCDVDPSGANPAGQGSLLLAPDEPRPLPGYGPLAEMLFALRGATDGGVGTLRERKAILRAQLRHPDQIGLAPGSPGDARLDQTGLDGGTGDAHAPRDAQFGLAGLIAADHLGEVELDAPLLPLPGERTRLDPGPLDPLEGGRERDAQRIGDVLVRFPGQVATCHVVDVEIEHYRGPVYDVQTETSLYLIGNGIASSNCRCSTTFVLAEDGAVPPPPVPSFVPKPPADKPEKPKKPARPKPPPKPKPAKPVLPGKPIDQRLKADKAGDAKVKAIADACDRIDAEVQMAKDSTRDRRRELLRQITSITSSGNAADPRIAQLEDELQKLIASFRDADSRKRAAVIDLIAPPAPAPIRFDRNPADGMDRLSGSALTAAEDARHFLSRVLAKGESTGLDVKVAQIPAGQEQRAYYRGGKTNQVHLSIVEKPAIAVHELGHAIEANFVTANKRVGEIAREFLAYRVAGEKPQKMATLFPRYNYDPGEMGRKDRFDQAFDPHSAYYVGKAYSGNHASEITSMGLQLLYEDPGKFAKADPEYCKFILGILDGSLR